MSLKLKRLQINSLASLFVGQTISIKKFSHVTLTSVNPISRAALRFDCERETIVEEK